jgi:hypothetical protein
MINTLMTRISEFVTRGVTCSLSPSWREPFLRLASLVQDVILDRRMFSLPQIIFILNLLLKTV